jgi:teichuronic acid biosynthesis glycosyltransferase TuaC
MRRVARRLPLEVVAPQAWSPADAAIRVARPTFRPALPERETIDGVVVHRPRVASVPGVLKSLDSRLMARGAFATVRGIVERTGATLIDAHFVYPDGHAATLIARRLGLPATLTLRGSKDQRLIGSSMEPSMRDALRSAARVFAVAESLRDDVARPLGLDPAAVEVIGNGVDLDRFAREDRRAARERLGLPQDAPVLIGVGNLIESKGFQRVLPLLPALRARHPGLVYLIVGGGASQGDLGPRLAQQAAELGIADAVRLCGRVPPDELRWYYSAADAFVLATAYEGWANVLLESMACGVPVVTTRVGGNAQVVAHPELGTLVDWWDAEAFGRAIDDALVRHWNVDRLRAHAEAHRWERRIDRLVDALEAAAGAAPGR